jgi:hypothetical protein
MSTVIVFGGGNAVVVAPGLEEVRAALQGEEAGCRLLEFERGCHDPHPDRRIYVNGSQVAYIEPEPERSWQGSHWTS